jgi:hypothetical protein
MKFGHGHYKFMGQIPFSEDHSLLFNKLSTLDGNSRFITAVVIPQWLVYLIWSEHCGIKRYFLKFKTEKHN